MTDADIALDIAITTCVYDLVEGLAREIEPNVYVSRSSTGLTLSNPDANRLCGEETTEAERATLRPWIVNASLWFGKVSIYRMFGAEINTDVELADPDSFNKIGAALRRWCRCWKDDPAEGQS